MAECKENSRAGKADEKAERGSSTESVAGGSSTDSVAGGSSPIKMGWSKWMEMRFKKLS